MARLYDIIWYKEMIHWYGMMYGGMQRWHVMMIWHNTIWRYVMMTWWYDMIWWDHDMMIWRYDDMVVCCGNMTWYAGMIRRCGVVWYDLTGWWYNVMTWYDDDDHIFWHDMTIWLHDLMIWHAMMTWWGYDGMKSWWHAITSLWYDDIMMWHVKIEDDMVILYDDPTWYD